MDLFCSENYSLQAVNFQKRVNYLSTYRKIYMRMCICLIGWKNDTGKEPWLRLGTLWFVLLIVFPRGNSHWLTVRDLTWQSAPCEKTPYLSCYQGCFIVMLISALTDTVKSLFLIAENTVITPRAKKVSPVWNCVVHTHTGPELFTSFGNNKLWNGWFHFPLSLQYKKYRSIKGHLNHTWKYFSLTPSISCNKAWKGTKSLKTGSMSILGKETVLAQV